MSEILVIMPPEWVEQNADSISAMVGDSLGAMQTFADTKHFSDLNQKLELANYFTDNLRIVDILVLNNQLYFKFGEI